MERLLAIKILTLHPRTMGGCFTVHWVIRLCHRIEFNRSAAKVKRLCYLDYNIVPTKKETNA